MISHSVSNRIDFVWQDMVAGWNPYEFLGHNINVISSIAGYY